MATQGDKEPWNSENILQSVDAALQMIELLGKHSPIGVADAAKMMGIGKSTAYRLLSTLEYRGFVKKDENAKFRLGLKVVYLGSLVLDTFDIVKVAHPHLEELSRRIEETVHLVVLEENNNACFIDKVVCQSTSFRMESTVGAQKSAYSTATGKVLLAFRDHAFQLAYASQTAFTRYTEHTLCDGEALLRELSHIRTQGYGFDAEESEEGLYCVAAPLFDYSGQAVAAISVSGPSVRMATRRDEIIRQLAETCRIISAELR